MDILENFLVNSPAVCLVDRYVQTLPLDIRETNLMFGGLVILPTPIT
jgi:hypothetical protein